MAEFLSHFLRTSDINDVIEDIIADTFFDDLYCYSYNHLIFLNFLFLDLC